ncbi:MAG TPA: TetR family transcriptional regulator C-terminal domain-containing protein, partial [Pseudonocardia sp.]
LDAAPDAGPLETLVASWGAIRASFDEYRGLAVAFLEAVAQARWQPELRTQLAETYRQIREQVSEMITERLPGLSGAEAAALASFQIAVCDGLLVQWLLDADATPSDVRLVAAFSAVLPPPAAPAPPDATGGRAGR